MTNDEGKGGLKVKLGSPMTSSLRQQPLGKEEEPPFPTNSIMRPRWFTQTLRDAQEHVKALGTTFKGSKPSKKFPNYMALISNNIDSKPSSFQMQQTNRFGGMPWWSTPPS